MEGMNPLADQIVKALLKAQTPIDIENALSKLDIDDAKDVIKLLVARYNNIIMQAQVERMIETEARNKD